MKVVALEYVKGKYKSSIFSSSSGYVVGLFRVKEASEELADLKNKTITFTGYFHELNNDDMYILYGFYKLHDRYGYQFQVSSYERVEPEGSDAIIEFLTSSFVKGCGEKTAKKIVEVLGDKAIALIKSDIKNLERVGLSVKQTTSIYKSIMNYYDSDEAIIYLKELGFSIREITKLLNVYGKRIVDIVKENIYSLIDYVDFNKLDNIYFKIYTETNEVRTRACIVEAIKRLTFETGDTYVEREDIISYLNDVFKIVIDGEVDTYLDSLADDNVLKLLYKRIYLMEYFQDEENIANRLYTISNHPTKMLNNFANLITWTQREYNIEYNEEQVRAIKEALKNSVTIITGGPGTGKTTIINGLLRMFQYMNNIDDLGMNARVALLAPTGRASKRMSETTNFGASTIHRYLKWNLETKEFGVNEYNPNMQDLVIVDEVSMIDNNLMSSLLKGINPEAKVVLVGDENQLPSVGPGNVLKNLIATDVFPHVRLTNIYRQSDNSFIPILADEIKNREVISNITEKRDDYNFLNCDRTNIKKMLKNIVCMSIDKGLTDRDIQVLAPMYKGENGIDNLNMLLQEIFNPHDDRLTEVQIGPVTYRINDKVINLVNNIDQNIFNGDIGYIKEINPKKNDIFMKIDFYGNIVALKREDVPQIQHAYAMSIHKSQGGEFNHVIMPITKEYNKMLYNKLIYTGVSRAKKSLVIIGSLEALNYAINNSYSVERRTSLEEMILNKFK